MSEEKYVQRLQSRKLTIGAGKKAVVIPPTAGNAKPKKSGGKQ